MTELANKKQGNLTPAPQWWKHLRDWKKSSGRVKDRRRRKIQKKEKMSNTTFTIYWTIGEYPYSSKTNDMVEAMQQMEAMRKCPGYSAITFCSENTDQVGKMGVDAVVNGVLPDGEEYVYMKRRQQ